MTRTGNTAGSVVTAVLGFVASLTQVLLVREAMVVFGGNEVVLGLFYFFWFSGIAVGAGLGTVSKKLITSRPDVNAFVSMVLLASAGTAAVIALRTSNVWLIDILPGNSPSPALAAGGSALAILPVGAAAGFAFPVCATYLEAIGVENSVAVGYWTEGAGALVGGLAATFAVVPFMHPVTAMVMAGGLSCVPFVFPVTNRAHMAVRITGATLAATAFLLVLLGPADGLDDWATRTEWSSRHKGIEFLEQSHTPYQLIQLGLNAGQYTMYLDGVPGPSFPDEFTPVMLANLYLCEHKNPKKVLMIGGLSSQLAFPALKHPLKELDVVELDPGIFEIMQPRLSKEIRDLLRDTRMRISYEDGRRAVKTSKPGSYDMIIVSVSEPVTAMANRYYTMEFFKEVDKALSDDGVLALSVKGSANYMDEPTAGMLGPIYSAMNRVFPDIVVTGTETLHLFGAKRSGILSADVNELGARWRSRNIEEPRFSGFTFSVFFPPGDRTANTMQRLKQASLHALPNTDTRPVTYLFGLVRWERIVEGLDFSGFVSRILDLHFGWSYAIILLALAALTVSWGSKTGAIPSLAVSTAGFCGIAMSISISYSFQVARGSLYSEVGLVLGSFMAGLALGGALATRFARKMETRGHLHYLLGGLLCCFGSLSVGLAIGLPVVQEAAESVFVFLALSGMTGAALGSIFPVAAELHARAGTTTASSAGRLDAADHIGAAIGGALAGVLLLPVLGLSGSGVVAGSACLVPGIFVIGVEIIRDHRM